MKRPRGRSGLTPSGDCGTVAVLSREDMATSPSTGDRQRRLARAIAWYAERLSPGELRHAVRLGAPEALRGTCVLCDAPLEQCCSNPQCPEERQQELAPGFAYSRAFNAIEWRCPVCGEVLRRPLADILEGCSPSSARDGVLLAPVAFQCPDCEDSPQEHEARGAASVLFELRLSSQYH